MDISAKTNYHWTCDLFWLSLSGNPCDI